MYDQRNPRTLRILAAVLLALGLTPPVTAELRLVDICRVKGQEETTLVGMGLVIGLKGTGDANARPTMQSLGKMMERLGVPLSQDPTGKMALDELKNATNVALVYVQAKVPGAGAREGDKLSCSISAISAKSLEGGTLVSTPLMLPGSETVYAIASGKLTVDDANKPTVARVHQGCQLIQSFFNDFTKDGHITLVLDMSHAGFQTAQDIEDLINRQPDFVGPASGTDQLIAKALDQVNIQVRIPENYQENPVLFTSLVLNQLLIEPHKDARVVIDERSGSIIIDDDVEIGAVAVAHKNLSIETQTGLLASQFVPVDPAINTAVPKLKALVDALNALQVPTSDVIDIIKALERSGKLYGRLIIVE